MKKQEIPIDDFEDDVDIDIKGDSNAVWTYRGYRIEPGHFSTAMVHLYRGEITRSNVWRTRLDTTTNWAIVSASAGISFAMSDPKHHHVVLILNLLLVLLLLLIESRRYRYYELWSHRVRLMETGFYAAMMSPPFEPDPDWAETLAETLLMPSFSISRWEAIGRRLRRNYVWIFLILSATWLLKIAEHPVPVQTLQEFVSRASVGPVPGEALIIAGLSFNVFLLIVALMTTGLQQASGEVLPEISGGPLMRFIWRLMKTPDMSAGHSMHHRNGGKGILRRKRQQLTALIICNNPEGVAQCVMHELKRGVTSLHGTGMFSGEDKDVLMIVITVTELARLKKAIRNIDATAFVVVVPAQEVLGRGFEPLR